MARMGRLIPVIVCDVIVIIAVGLRFWCKHTLKAGYHGDDWWTLITTVSFIGGEVALLWGVINGIRDGGTIGEIHEQLQTTDDPEVARSIEIFLQSIFIAVTISFFVVYAIKIAILLLYRRIFSTRGYRLAANILIAISTAWFIGLQATNLAHCRPIETFWTDYEGGQCVNFNLMFFVGGVIEIVIDVAILIVPMIGTYNLHASYRTKVLVSGIFLLGCFSVITNILRVYYTYQPNERFVNLRDSETWTVIHIASAILCACLPVYKPIRKVLGAASLNIHKLLSSSKQYLSNRSAKSSYNPSSSYIMGSVSNNRQGPEQQESTSILQESTRDLLHVPMYNKSQRDPK